ncbi:unnamed protein product [Moneuplotes crassus]|uniref:histidine kinase n=1 Tax=Euplotes crassus TaxID=5936 RepID=A0AAD1UB74_EUPCR|nr:unnamed protein product [Moneuplotes crassus]
MTKPLSRQNFISIIILADKSFHKGCNHEKKDEDQRNFQANIQVDSYINDVIEETIKVKYQRYIKLTCWVAIFLCSIIVIMNASNVSQDKGETKIQLAINASVFIVILLVLLIVLQYKPIYILYFIPLMIGVSSYMCNIQTFQKGYYRLDEFHISSCCFSHLIMILVPNKWKANSIIHTLSMIHLVYGIWKTFGITNSDMIFSLIFSCLWFTISSYLLIIKMRSMYAEILKNKKLIAEMKKVMQILPFGVVIWPSKVTDKWFTNIEFTSKYAKIRKDLEELNSIDVSFVEEDKQNHQDGPRELSAFLKAQQQQLDSKDSMTDNDVKIECNPHSLIEQADDTDSRTCNVKTLMVEWEGAEAYMHVFVDITDVIKLEEAKNNIKCQKIMFTSASHEFRTPLNSITNSFDIVFGSFKTIEKIGHPYFSQLQGRNKIVFDESFQELSKFVKIGKNSSMLLLTLVEDVLNLAKMEAGTFTILKELFSIQEILEEIQDIFTMQCEHKGLKFLLDAPPDIKNMLIHSDKARLKQIILNLVSNSYKFTFRGYIKIECKIVEKLEKLFVQFKVRDTGMGISEEQQEKLFKLFSMVSDTKGLNPNGTGIGLTVSKRYVEAIGGEIHLHSALRKGTDVIFTIPIDDESEFIPNNIQNNEESCNIFENEEPRGEGRFKIEDLQKIAICSREKFKQAS